MLLSFEPSSKHNNHLVRTWWGGPKCVEEAQHQIIYTDNEILVFNREQCSSVGLIQLLDHSFDDANLSDVTCI